MRWVLGSLWLESRMMWCGCVSLANAVMVSVVFGIVRLGK